MKLVVKWKRKHKNLEELREFFQYEDLSQICLDIIDSKTNYKINLVNYSDEKIATIKFKR